MTNASLIQGPEVLNCMGTVKRLMEDAEFPTPLLYDYRFVVERVKDRAWQLWLLFEDAEEPSLMMVTWLSQFPAGKLCFIEMVCGEGLVKLLEKGSVFDNWCKMEGVDLMRSTTRPSIAKFCEKLGWRQGTTSIFKWVERIN